MSPRYLISTSALAALWLLPALATAAPCGANGECIKGYTCTSVSVPCAVRPCPSGDTKCQDASAAAVAECAKAVSTACTPVACQSNSDCADGMVCHVSKDTRCTGAAVPPCAPNTECAPTPDPYCQVVETSQCVPQWAMPCQAASDCGAGFTCEATQQCACSGSAGVASSSGSGSAGAAGAAGATGITYTSTTPSSGAPVTTPKFMGTGGSFATGVGGSTASDVAKMPVAPPDYPCTCTPSTEKACKVVVTNCNTEADCPTGWTCESRGANSTSCAASSDGTTTCAPQPPPAKSCIPPYYDLAGGSGHNASDVGYGEAMPTVDVKNSGTTTGAPSGSTQTTGSGTAGTLSTPAPGPTVPSTGGTSSAPEKTSATGTAVPEESSGCQMAAGLPSSTQTGGMALGGLLGLLGLALGRRRRNARS